MPQVRGFEDGFIDLVQEQLELSRTELADIDAQIAELREERVAAAKRVEQLETLLNSGDPVDLPPKDRKFADANAVVELITEHGQAMHYLDIFNELVRRGYAIGGKGQADTLLSRYHNDPRLERVARGTYDLVERPNTGPWHLNGSDGLDATGHFESGGIRVCAGSQARKHIGSISKSNRKALRIREELIQAGQLEDKGSHYELQHDHVFDSPSLAATVMSGVALNGWKSWKNAEKQTLDQVHRQGTQQG